VGGKAEQGRPTETTHLHSVERSARSVFESDGELDGLQRLLDESSEKAGERLIAAWGKENRLSARQLAGFRGVKLVAVASVNLRAEPRVASRT